MKKIKLLFLVALILLDFTFVTGCWDYKEINERAAVSGVAIDKSSDGNYYLTAEIVVFKGTGKVTTMQSKRIHSKGKTIFEAVRNMIRVSGKRLYWSHANVVILSKSVAKQGIFQIVDVFSRAYETRLSYHFLVSKEKTARALLSQEPVTSDIRTVEMWTMINNERKFLGKSPHVDLRDYINMLSEKGQAPILAAVGLIKNQGKLTSELSGTAIFNRDKLAGFLNEHDTKYLLFVKNQIQNTVFSFGIRPKGRKQNIVLHIYNNKTIIKAVNVEGKPSIKILINPIAALNELGTGINLFDEKGLKVLKREAEKTLKLNVENVIKKVKSKYDLDIFGFANVIKREHPSLWKTIVPNWDKVLRNLDVQVSVGIHIKGSGFSGKPIKIGEE